MQSAAATSGSGILFQKTWGGSNVDTGQAVAIDSAGNIYVAGLTYSYGFGAPTCPSIVILKYSAFGDLLWQKLWYNGTSLTIDSLTADSSGNVYIGGTVRNAACGSGGTAVPAVLIKLNNQGTLQWQMALESVNAGSPVFRSLATDSSGDIYAVGNVYYPHGAGGYDMLAVKFNATTGSVLWERTWGGASEENGNGAAIDLSGNLLISGYTYSFGPSTVNAVLLGLTPSGTFLFNKIIGNGGETATGLAIDKAGNAYLAGWTPYRGSLDMMLLKFDSSTSLTWQRAWGGSNGTDTARGVTVDSSGNPVMVGNTNSYGWGGSCFLGVCTNLALVRVSSSGIVLSSLVLGAYPSTVGYGVAADPYGMVTAVGYVNRAPPYSIGSGNSTTGTLSLAITTLGNSTLGTPAFRVSTVLNGVISNVSGSQSYAGGADILMLKYGAQPQVTFATNPLGVFIIFNGTTFFNGQTASFPMGNATAAALPPTGYTFTSWTSTGGLILTSASKNPTNVTIAGPGTLTANFTKLATTPIEPNALLLATLITTVSVILIRRRRR